jgi:Leucine-rich repeat (LRR) protein
MKKQFLLLLLSFSFSFAHAQTVTRYDVPVTIFAKTTDNFKNSSIYFDGQSYDYGQTIIGICKGDTLIIDGGGISNISCVCGYPYWINTTQPCTGSCIYQSSAPTPTIQGSSIFFHTTPPAITSCEPPTSEYYHPYCKANPSQTSIYTMEWEKTKIEPDGPCSEGKTKTTIWHYKGKLTVTVIAPTPPIITVSKNKITTSESISINSDCNFLYPNWSSSRNVVCEAKCSSVDYTSCNSNRPSTCQPFSLSFRTYGKKQLIAQKNDGGCVSKISDPIEVIVRPCGKATFGFSDAALETQIKDIEREICNDENRIRFDYHFYSFDKILCSSSTQCSLNNIWQLYKSKISNQAPIAEDFKRQEPSTTLFASEIFNPPYNPNSSINSGQKIDLFSPENIALKTGLFSTASGSGAAGLFAYTVLTNIFSLPKSYANPIALYVDETNKCVTNYTLPEHALYPGKVTRCIVEECGKIKVQTFGEGVTKDRNGTYGTTLGKINENFGATLFHNVDERLAALVRQTYPQRVIQNLTTETLTNLGIENKNWIVRKFKIKHPNNDEITLFARGDTGVFKVMNDVKMNFATTGTYLGMSVKNQAANGTWSTDGNTAITIDGANAQISSITTDSFVIKGKMKSYVDTVLVDADYTMVFQKQGCDVPIAPSVSNVRTTSATVNWTSTVLGASFLVEYIPSGSTNWIALPSTTNTSVSITGLIGATLYTVRVTTICSPTESSIASVPAFFTTALICNIPTTPSVSNLTSISATFTWAAVAGASTYIVEYKPTANTTWIALSTTTNTQISVAGLTSATAYSVRVTGDCNSTPSSVATFTTPTSCNAPATPSVSNISPTSAIISWASSGSGVSYVVEYKASSSTSWIATPSTTLTTMSLTGLTAATAYTVRVTTTNCNSTPSGVANFATKSFAFHPFPAGLPTCLEDDFTQLAVLYELTGGDSWTNKTNWFTNPNMATWSGITLTPSGCDIQYIYLSGNNLTGELPMLSFPELLRFHGSGNKLTGSIPDFNMPKLTEFYFQDQKNGGDFTGLIPNFNMPNLKSLILWGNQLSGSIPNFNMPLLEQLYLDGNLLSGAIPSFNNLNSLKELILQNNQLTGTIPNFNMPNLQKLYLFSNQLSGSMPNFNLPSLTQLYGYGNQLSGSMPNFTMPNLVVFNLGNNQLSGTIPNFNMPLLTEFYLDNNKLTGTIPNFNMPNLQKFYLYNNQLTGSIPNFNMPLLVQLYLYSNQLSGSIPNFNMPSLTLLYLYNNQLSGSIPNLSLPNLVKLQLQTNQLTGSIPNFNLPLLDTLFLRNNQLTGTIPNFNLPNLRSLSLRNNQLTGSVPDFNLPKLKQLRIDTNQLSGILPNFSNCDLLSGGIAQFRIDANKFIFGDIEGKPWLAVSDLKYTPQAKIPITLSSGLLTVNTGSANNVQQFEWYKNDVLVATNQSNTFTPSGAGKYYCKVKHNTVTVAAVANKNLILQSEDYNVGTIPVELLNFTAHPLNKTTQLNWQTASEKNASYFEVQRSRDGKTFEKIGEVKANGNSAALRSYNFVDEKPNNGVNYYRLRQIDNDGTATLSNIVSVTFTANQKLQVFPNPAKDKLTIMGEVNSAYVIFDALGRAILRGTLSDNQTDINVAHLPSGMYFIKVKDASVKFFKQ